jgi:signal transduction histidine kinase/CheY-like chemotaxis protein
MEQNKIMIDSEHNNLRNVLNNLDDGVYIVNGHYDIKYVNTILKKQFGEIQGRKCFNYFHGRNEVCTWCKNKEVLAGKTVRWTFKAAETSKSYNIIDTPLKNPDGTIAKLQISRDITEQKKLQQESVQYLQQIIQSDKLASLGEVVAGVAHEINNPNSFITYNIPLLEEIWQVLRPLIQDRRDSLQQTSLAGISISELCQDMSEILEAIKVGSNRINNVVNNLKDFARMDESAPTKSFQLNEIINKVYSIVGAQMRKTVRNIEFNLEKDLPLITGHFQKIEQVLANILTNASHAFQGQQNTKVSISTRFIDRLDAVIISIEDNGVGMAPETLARIFEPFFTTRRNSGGTGLGLSVSYGLIQEHRGCIGVLSRPQIGTRFSIFLPKSPKTNLQNLRPALLLVDEEENIPSVQGVLQESTDSKIFTLNNHSSVTSFLKEHPEVDTILSPVESSQIKGWHLLEAVKKQSPLPAVILTTKKNPEQISNPTNFLPDYLLQQPLSARHLSRAIDSFARIRL